MPDPRQSLAEKLAVSSGRRGLSQAVRRQRARLGISSQEVSRRCLDWQGLVTKGVWQMNTEALRQAPCRNGFAISIFLVRFVTGAIVMSFEMLGSRYLAPAFGAGIYTWASLISTVLAALCAGYFLGGTLADRYPSPVVLAATVAVGSIYLLLLPAFADAVVQFFA